MHNGPYTIVIPALGLRSQQGGDGEAVINFLLEPLHLGGTFWIEFWLKPVAYPSNDSWAVLGATFETSAGEKKELVLRLGAQVFCPFFEHRLEPFKRVPQLGQWMHVALAYNHGKWTQVMYDGGMSDEGSADLREENYRLTELNLLAMKSAENWFAELQIWKEPRDRQRLEANWRFRSPASHDYESGLISHWSLDEGCGRVLVDKRGGNLGVVEFGGEWQRDSGLVFPIGRVESLGEQRYPTDSGQYVNYNFPPRWQDPPPPVDQQIAYLDLVLSRRMQQMQSLEEKLQRTRGLSKLSELEDRKRKERDTLVAAKEQLEALTSSCAERVRIKKEEIERMKTGTLASIKSSQKINLEHFILKFQEDLARGRESIRKHYGRVYGMDSVSVEVKMVPGIGGVGLHLPKPDGGEADIDPNRLSTLKLRFRASKVEDEAEVELATVPWLEGNTEDFARRKLGEAGFRVDVVYQVVADPRQHGRILMQIYDAKEGNQAALDSLVTLIVGRCQ